ncbi:MAG: hypothetical protein AAFV43_05935 [Planctomycetota bacterium]
MNSERPDSRTFIAFAIVLIGVGVNAPCLAATDDASENLGDALLGDGLGDLFAPSPESRAAPPRDPRPRDSDSRDDRPRGPRVPSSDELRRRMEQSAQPAPGEDAGPRKNPLVEVADRMQNAGRLLGDGRIETAALPIQRQVVADLDRLIAAMEQQQQGSSSAQQQPQKQQQSQRSESKPGAGKPSGGKPSSGQPKPGGRQAAMQSSGTPQGGESRDPTPSPLGADAMKAAWGHLPQRVREQVLQSTPDEFLPEYREAIEAYYRRLAEEDDTP